MKELLNTLFVMTQGSYVHIEGETVRVDIEGSPALRVPIHHLGAIILFGNVMISPFLLYRCAEQGRSIAFFTEGGRFKARVEGPVSGNVLLRCAQHKALSNAYHTLDIARTVVAGKLQNTRQVLLRGARDCKSVEETAHLHHTADQVAVQLSLCATCLGLDELRGIEGAAAQFYFDVFDLMLLVDKSDFSFAKRSRRPPRDRTNALLSFLYSMLTNDCASALEGVGLDPQVGYLHALRPGRPSLALDLVEEFRAVIADRLALTLINRRQITPKHFDVRPGDAVYLNEEGRKAVVTAYQKRKQEEVMHSLLKEKTPIGLLPHIQARLLARYIRGDTPMYMPYIPQ